MGIFVLITCIVFCSFFIWYAIQRMNSNLSSKGAGKLEKTADLSRIIAFTPMVLLSIAILLASFFGETNFANMLLKPSEQDALDYWVNGLMISLFIHCFTDFKARKTLEAVEMNLDSSIHHSLFRKAKLFNGLNNYSLIAVGFSITAIMVIKTNLFYFGA